MDAEEKFIKTWMIDKFGLSYDLEIMDYESGPCLYVERREKRIAYVKSVTQDSKSIAGFDILVEDSIDRLPLLEKMQRFFLKEPSSYRRRGIGETLMKYFIDYCKASGFQNIEGHIYKEDLKLNPKLPEWYAQFGFLVTENSASHHEDSFNGIPMKKKATPVYKISLFLV
jgi:GNAT superfamily N-acetyltransferase